MAPEITAGPAEAVSTAVDAIIARDWDEELARKTLPRLHDSVPNTIKTHTPAPLIPSVLKEGKRKKDLTAFIRSVHDKAVGFAMAFLMDEYEARSAVAAAYLKLWNGKTAKKHFFRALKQTCLDRIREFKREAQIFAPLKDCVISQDLSVTEVECDSQGGDTVMIDLASQRRDDRDPLDILEAREEMKEARKLAETERAFWWIRQKKWGKELGLRQGGSGRDVNDLSRSNA